MRGGETCKLMQRPDGTFSNLVGTSQSSELTPNTPLIHTPFTYSKWNMGEICGLKFNLSYVHRLQQKILAYHHVHSTAK